MLNKLKFKLFFIFLLCNLATTVYALDITLQWTSNNEPNLAGYRVFYREEGQTYDYENPYWESMDPICTIYDLDETQTYYFVVRAFDANGSESANSNEVLLMEGTAVNRLPTENINSNDSNDIGCFIATAAYGSLMEPHVKILRDFRDRFLFDNAAGRRLVRLYYNHSPPIADFIAEHDSLRAMVRISLLPFVGVGWMALKMGLLSTVALLLVFISCFLGLVRFRRKYKE